MCVCSFAEGTAHWQKEQLLGRKSSSKLAALSVAGWRCRYAGKDHSNDAATDIYYITQLVKGCTADVVKQSLSLCA